MSKFFTYFGLIVGMVLVLFGCGQKKIENHSRRHSLGSGSDDAKNAENMERWQRTDPIDLKVDPLAAEIRLLNGLEFSNTIESLLGLRPALMYSSLDQSAGYSTGAGLQLDHGLLTSITNEIVRLSKSYVSTKLLSQYPCFQSENTECLSDFIESLATKAFRRPPSITELQTLSDFYAASLGRLKSSVLAREELVARILLSPQFLYRTEIGKPVEGQEVRFMSDYEIASLISYTLTGDMPDQNLMQVVKSGTFSREVARDHIQRILGTEKSQKWLLNFFQQWLQVDDLDEMIKNPGQFPKLTNPGMAIGLQKELQAFVSDVVFKRQGTLSSLFLEPKAFINKDTAPLYGKTSLSAALQSVDTDPNQRLGILTLASVMAVHAANAERYKDKPISRGLLVYEKILCMPMLVPSGVNTIDATTTALETHPNFATMTVREQHEAMMEQDQSCQSCHARFMPIGFLFGNFDALGAFQTQQNGKPINTSVAGLKVLGTEQTSSFSGAAPFIKALAKNDKTATCFSEQLSRFVVGKLDLGGLPALYHHEFNTVGQKIAPLIVEILTAPELYLRKDPQ